MAVENKSAKRILVVEDDENILQFLKYILDLPGVQVTLAKDGMEAVNAITQLPPDLIMLDLMIPKIDGFNICKLIKSSDAFKTVKVIVMSALRYQLEPSKMEQLGADAFFTKPLDPEELLRRVKSLLGL